VPTISSPYLPTIPLQKPIKVLSLQSIRQDSAAVHARPATTIEGYAKALDTTGRSYARTERNRGRETGRCQCIDHPGCHQGQARHCCPRERGAHGPRHLAGRRHDHRDHNA